MRREGRTVNAQQARAAPWDGVSGFGGEREAGGGTAGGRGGAADHRRARPRRAAAEMEGGRAGATWEGEQYASALCGPGIFLGPRINWRCAGLATQISAALEMCRPIQDTLIQRISFVECVVYMVLIQVSLKKTKGACSLGKNNVNLKKIL